jgi:hypothetical protein
VANVVAVLVVLLLIWFVISILRRRGHGIVARRGMSVGADLGAMADKPRVRVREVAKVGPDRFRLVLAPESGLIDGTNDTTPPDLALVVLLEFGFELLHRWKRSQSPLAIVMSPGNRILRLRSIDDLQPLTLRRADPE